MDVEILHISNCPSWVEAGERLRSALDERGLESTAIRYRLLSTAADAADATFSGSPTILVDGVDLFPGAARSQDLSCRIYVTPDGVSGVPSTDQIVEALGAHVG
jgi:hypothetical protein